MPGTERGHLLTVCIRWKENSAHSAPIPHRAGTCPSGWLSGKGGASPGNHRCSGPAQRVGQRPVNHRDHGALAASALGGSLLALGSHLIPCLVQVYPGDNGMSHCCDFLSGLRLCQGYSPDGICGTISFAYVTLVLTIERGSLVNACAQGRR